MNTFARWLRSYGIELALSLALAITFWLVADLEQNPARTETLTRAIILENLPDDLLITNQDDFPRTVEVAVYAPSRTWDDLDTDADQARKIIIYMDLADLAPGEHDVPLRANVNGLQAAVRSITPATVAVNLSLIHTQEIPISIVWNGSLELGYETGEITQSAQTVAVTGAPEIIEQVAEIVGRITLNNDRDTFEANVPLVAIDASGEALDALELEPSSVSLTVEVLRQQGFREISVQPTFTGQPPEGYMLGQVTYDPQTVTISGPESLLESLPDVVLTSAIDLSGETVSFERTVQVQLPPGINLPEAQDITVNTTIIAIETTQLFENVPVTLIGLLPDYEADIAPETVDVLVTGPVVALENFTNENLHVVADISGLGPGEHQVELVVDAGIEAIGNTSALPSVVGVTIVEATIVPTPTASATPKNAATQTIN